VKSAWSDADAAACVAHYAAQGIGRDLAQRIYTTRLLGRDPALVLHGGGNTSVKTEERDVFGDLVPVLRIKGSGWDMAAIEPPGLPAVRLQPLGRLLALETLSDEDMVNVQRLNLLDSAAPNPSVETLLHAFLPHRFIDHTHATAVLALTDQADGDAIAAEVFSDHALLVPYVMPGFALAKLVLAHHRRHPDCRAMILLRHGVLAMGDTAREAYDRMIEIVSIAERRLARGRKPVFPAGPVSAGPVPARIAAVSEVAPILRGLLADPLDPGEGLYRRPILAFRNGPAVLDYVNGRDVGRYAMAGVATPDHVIRIKPKPLIVPAPAADGLDQFRQQAETAIAAYGADYRAYFDRHNARHGGGRTRLDLLPRVVLVPGLGLFAAGRSARDAGVNADVFESTLATVQGAESVGRFAGVPEADLFDMEYWSLEQAKLGKDSERRLARHVVVVTGGGGTIGAATARAFADEGAEIAVLDRDETAAERAASAVGGVGFGCDVTDGAAVAAAFDRVCARFGGVDIVVSNAGAAWQGRIGDVGDGVLHESFDLNFFAHQTVAAAAVRVFRRQRLGGALLFNVSKQAVNPGPDFGPYGIPKAATLALLRQYAVDHGADGIRANGVNADRIPSGLLTPDLVAARARARGVTDAAYLAGNLLGRAVTADDVAQAFVALALARKTTGAVLSVDGGNIAAALR